MNENAAEFYPDADDVFSRIATDYDRYCDYFSLYIQRLWKRAFSARVSRFDGDWLDLASGTGDIPHRVLKAKARTGCIEVTDLCQPMLNMAKAKLSSHRVRYAIVDACDMHSIADDSYDVISMAFAMKIIDREKALREIMRCLKPGGVFLCIEASRIGWAPIQTLYLTYMKICLPLMGRIIAQGDRSAYDYLLRGIEECPSAACFAEALKGKGFLNVSYTPLTFGIVAIHEAYKPQQLR